MHLKQPLLFIALIFAASSHTTAAKPNIVLVFIDDMGWSDLSCFGGDDAKTPHIDRMASEGIAFERFYVNSPICSPSRTAISTGQYPQRWGITSYLAYRKRNAQRKLANWLDPKAPMLARSLQTAGYATGHFGKWHMGGQRDVDDAPPITSYGFDAALTNFEGLGPKLLPLAYMGEKRGRQKIWQDAEKLGDGVRWVPREKVTGGFVDAALAFIDKAQADDKPFYINVWPDDVHTPMWPSPGRYDESIRKRYVAVLEEMDAQLAPLFKRIRGDAKLRDNTLVLICSDNGHQPNVGSSDPLRGCKTTLFEGGIRSPLIAWAPGLIAEDNTGERNRKSVFAAFDLVPTLLALTKTPGPEGVAYDGEALADVLLGRATTSRKAPLFFSRPPDRKNFEGLKNLPDLAVIDGRWKLLCDIDGSRLQLYDLDADIAERTNLADDQPEITARMKTQLLKWFDELPEPARAALKP